jgi:hypothetical protein
MRVNETPLPHLTSISDPSSLVGGLEGEQSSGLRRAGEVSQPATLCRKTTKDAVVERSNTNEGEGQIVERHGTNGGEVRQQGIVSSSSAMSK